MKANDKQQTARKGLSVFVPSIFMFLFFILYTVLIKVVNVAPIGPQGSTVGFSGLNGEVSAMLGFNEGLYKLSEYLGYAALGVAACFAFMGAYQLITRKSVKKVDREIILLGSLYAVVIVFYVLFEKLVINYRPVMLEAELEPSYPSSHTMLALTVLVSAAMVVDRYVKDKWLLLGLRCFFILLLVAIVVFRLLSGVHWVTDIAGGIILSAALCLWFDEMLR